MPTNPVIDHIDYNNTTYDIKDTTSGYITDAGYTVETQAVEIVPEQSVTTAKGLDPFASGNLVLAEGITSLDDVPDTLTITFNGTEYVCSNYAPAGARVKLYGANIAVALGETVDWSVYPFNVTISPELGNELDTESAGTYTVKAVGEAKTVVVSEEFKQAVDQTAGATNITATYNFDTTTWTYPSLTPTSIISDFNDGKAIILEFSYIRDSTTYKTYGKMLDYSLSIGDNTSGAITFSLMSYGIEPYLILQLSFRSNSWAMAIWFNPATESDPRCYWIRSSQSTNLNYWTEPGTYNVESGETYTNLPNFQGYSFTSGIVEVLVTENSSIITQRFITSDSNSSGSNIFAIRHSINGGPSWTSWRYDNNMSSHLKWDSGSHDANYAPPGTIWCRNGSSYTTNLPGSGTYGMLVTTGYWKLDNSCSHQTYTEYSSSNLANSPSTTGIYVRDSISGNWSAWVKIGPASYTDANNISY